MVEEKIEGEGETKTKDKKTRTAERVIKVEHTFQSIPPKSKEGSKDNLEKKKVDPPVNPPVTPPPTQPPAKPVKPPKKGKTSDKEEGSSEGDTELEKVKKELEEKTALLTKVAMDKFTDEKNTLLESIKGKVPDDQYSAIEDSIATPEDLERTKQWIAILTGALEIGTTEVGTGTGNETKPNTDTDPTKKKAKVVEKKKEVSTGKAILDRQEGQGLGTYENVRQMIDDLYDTLLDPRKSQAERKEANRKISEMFNEIVKAGKARIHKGMGVPEIDIMYCPACKSVMTGNICENCGYELPRWEKERVK